MANKALKEARRAYNKNKSTKNRIDIETGKKLTKKKKPETKSHYGQVDTKNKEIGGTNAKKAFDKNKTDKKPVKAHYGQVESKTRNTTGSLAAKVTNTYKSNVKNAQENKSKLASSHFGQVTQSKIDQSEEAGKKKFGVGTYSTSNAQKAKTKSDKTQEKLDKKGEKTVQTLSDADLKAEQDKAEDRAKRQTAWFTHQMEIRGKMTRGEAEEAVKKAGENARKKTKEDHSLTYSNATMSNEDILREMNASTHANTKVKDTKEADKAKREARFYTNREVAAGNMTQEEADKIIKQAGKGHWTTQSANILDKLGGEGTAEESGTRQAGQMNDSKFASGVMQGLSYGDNTRAIGKYNKQAAELVDTVKQSGAYNTGYMTGQGLQFMLGGTNKMTDALVKGVTKGGAMRSALNVGLRKGGADMMFEAPLNTLDAIKMSTDANGNFDASAFKKYMLLNSGLSGGMGGIIGGVGAKMTKAQAKSYLELSAKYQRGLATEDEIAKLSNIQKKFDNIRQGNDVAKTDIIDRADYDAKVHNEVFSKNGNANDAIDAMNGVSTHSEKMNYAATIKENADAQFEVLRAERQVLREQLTGASPEQITKIQKQLAENQQALDRIGGIANVAERELAISQKKNLRAVQDLTDNVGKMEKTTGVSYKVMSDADMRKAITDDMAQAADNLERRLADGEFPASERAEIEAQIKELRKGATDDYFYKGFYHKNADGKTEILINSDSPQAHQTVIGHETGHLIKSSNEEEFFKLGKDLENYAKKVGDWDAVYEQLKRSYPEADRKELREEITCELLGRYVYGKDDTFIKQLAGEQPSVLKQIVDYIKKLLSGTNDKEMAKELQAIIDKTSALVKNIDKNADAKAINADYLKAAKAGDEKTAQKYVDDLARKKEIGTARFSKEAKPKKSLYNYGNEKPEQKISKKVEALQKENDAQIKTMTTSNNADEVVEALEKSDEVEAKIEGLGSKPRRGESKAENPKAETKEPSLDDMPAGLSKEEVVKYVEKEYGSKDAFLKKMGEERWREKRPETAKIFYDNKYASDDLKKSIIDINKAGIVENVEKAEKAAKKYNELDKKIGGLTNRINKAKNKDYPTEAEKTAHIAELEDELKTLRSQQAKAAGEIENLGKMKAVDDSVDPQEQFHKLRGDTGKVNRELKNDSNLKNEDKWIKDKWNSVRRLWEDSLIEVENVAKRSGTDKKLREEILTAANRVRNSQNVANFWITQGRSSFDNKLIGKSLDEIFPKELVENEAKYKDFQEYLIMKHVPARHAKGTDIYPEVSPDLADKIVKKLEGEYGEELTSWADDVYGYLKDLQQYRVDSGMLSKEAADKFAKDYPFYVPTNRANDDEAIDFFTGGLSNQIRTAKGGSNDVLDMYAQLYTATNKTIHAAEENQMLNLYFRAKGVTEEQIKQYGNDDLEHAVINATVNKKTGSAKVSFFIDGKPVEFPCSHQLALGLRELDGLEFERLMNAAKISTLYGKPFKALITDWNIVFGVRNGMRDMQQAVVNSKDTRYFGSSFGAASHAVAHDDSPYRKLYASMGGERAQLVSYDAVAKNLGIEKQGKVDAIHEKVQDWVDASVNVKGKEIHTNPVHLIEGVNGAIEMMPRMCEFIGTLRKQADKMLKQQGSSLKKLRKEIIAEVEADKSIGQSMKSAEVENRLAQKVIDMVDKDTIDSAMRNANDITLNFGRSGVLGKALNMGFVPYLNPSIQGLSKLVRLFTEAGGEGGWKALASLGMKLGTFTIAPAVFNEVLLRDNEDYQNLNTRDKDNNFFIPLDMFGEAWEGKFFKFPKPRENAVLAEPVEYGLRYFLDKSEYAFFDWDKLKTEDVPLWDKIPLTDEGKQSLRTALDNIGVINPATSNMVSPLWQTFNNKTWYGGSIESAYETSVNDETGKPNVPVNERYDVSTTGLAIWLGQTKGAKALNLSPKKIDNILDSYTGMVYDLYLSQTTEEAKTRGNYLFRTVASQFVKDSVFSNKLSTKAWEKMDGMTKKEQDAYKSKYMYDTFKYDDAMDVITADKNMTVQEKMDAKRALMIKKNKLNRAAINGEENNSNPLKDISKYLGANKTLNNFLPKSGDEDYDNWTDYYKNYKKTKGFKNLTPAQKEKQAQKFLDVYTLGVRGQSKISGDFHDSPSWGMTGVAAAQRFKQGKLSEKDAKTIMESCGVYESQTESYFKYADHGGNVSRYAVTKKNNNKAEALAEELGVPKKGSVWENKYSKEKGIKGGVLSMSLATGKADFKDRAYYISNSGDSNMLIKMNAARGYSEKYGHTTKQLIKLGKKADTDGNTYLSNEEIESACMTIKKGKATSEERAMAWVLLGGNPNKNPFGAIGNYAHDGDTGITADEDEKSGGGRRGRRGRRRRGGGGGGSSKGTMPKTDTGAIKGKVTDVFATSNGSKDSNLNDAYRKKARKSRENIYKGK